MLLAIEPTGDLAEPSPAGVRLLGIEVTRPTQWPSLRHVFDLGDDVALYVEIDGLADVRAFGVQYTLDMDELLTPL